MRSNTPSDHVCDRIHLQASGTRQSALCMPFPLGFVTVFAVTRAMRRKQLVGVQGQREPGSSTDTESPSATNSGSPRCTSR